MPLSKEEFENEKGRLQAIALNTMKETNDIKTV